MKKRSKKTCHIDIEIVTRKIKNLRGLLVALTALLVAIWGLLGFIAKCGPDGRRLLSVPGSPQTTREIMESARQLGAQPTQKGATFPNDLNQETNSKLAKEPEKNSQIIQKPTVQVQNVALVVHLTSDQQNNLQLTQLPEVASGASELTLFSKPNAYLLPRLTPEQVQVQNEILPIIFAPKGSAPRQDYEESLGKCNNSYLACCYARSLASGPDSEPAHALQFFGEQRMYELFIVNDWRWIGSISHPIQIEMAAGLKRQLQLKSDIASIILAPKDSQPRLNYDDSASKGLDSFLAVRHARMMASGPNSDAVKELDFFGPEWTHRLFKENGWDWKGTAPS